MIKIGFVQPSSEYLHDPFRGDPHTHLYILTILENYFGNKIEVCLIDLRGIKKEFAMSHIPECDIYLHSVYTLDFDEQVSIVAKIRHVYPKSVHIAGGPHINFFREKCLKYFDCLIFGEGEEIIIRSVEDFLQNKMEKIYEHKGIVDINAYPFPSRKYLPKSSTARENTINLKSKPEYSKLLGTTTVFSRGCPYQCHFCALRYSRENSPGIRYRLPDKIRQEIEYLQKDYGIQGLNLLDEIGIPLKPQMAISRLEAIGKTGILWRGQCRVDGLSQPIAKLAKESGCIALGLGVESVNQLSLNLINKQIDVDVSRRTIAMLKENGIEVRLYIILGLPGEPEDIVERTWSFIKETSPEVVFLSLFTIRPGTEVYNHPEKFGIKSISTDWQKTMHMYGRFGEEKPNLTFEYYENTPWGKSTPSHKIIENYIELQSRLREAGKCSL